MLTQLLPLRVNPERQLKSHEVPEHFETPFVGGAGHFVQLVKSHPTAGLGGTHTPPQTFCPVMQPLPPSAAAPPELAPPEARPPDPVPPLAKASKLASADASFESELPPEPAWVMPPDPDRPPVPTPPPDPE